MKNTSLTFLGILLASLCNLQAGGPSIYTGLCAHVVDDESPVDQKIPGGFVVINAQTMMPSPKKFETAKALLAYIQSLPKDEQASIRRNGVWLYSDDQTAFFHKQAEIRSEHMKKEYQVLLSLCAEEHIPVFLGFTQWKPALPDFRQNLEADAP